MKLADGAVLGLLGMVLVLAAPPWREAAASTERGSALSLSDLETAVHAWRTTGETPPGFPLDLAGLNFLWQASPGDGSRVVAISRVHGGYLALFDEEGSLLDLLETGEIYYSVLLCDLDQDAVAEVITDEVEGFGTGYLDRRFHIYKRQSDSLVDLGTRTSYRSVMMYPEEGEPRPEVTRGLVRCDPGDGMQSRGLAYVVEHVDEGGESQVIRTSRLHIQGGKLVELGG